jgi:hypothetical protein
MGGTVAFCVMLSVVLNQNWEGVREGVEVTDERGEGVFEGVGVPVGVCEAVLEPEGVWEGVGVSLGVGVTLPVCEMVGVTDAEGVSLPVAVDVAEGAVAVGLKEIVGVMDTDTVGPTLEDAEGVFEGVTLVWMYEPLAKTRSVRTGPRRHVQLTKRKRLPDCEVCATRQEDQSLSVHDRQMEREGGGREQSTPE